jgi:Methylene-tetrahydrofolate reductase C terminal
VLEKFCSKHDVLPIPLYTRVRKSVRELNPIPHQPVPDQLGPDQLGPDQPGPYQPDERCPKRMTFGPCGAVTLEGGCEIDGVTCPFVHEPTRTWNGLVHQNDSSNDSRNKAAFTPAARTFLEVLEHRPVIVTDMPGIALDADSICVIAAALAGSADAVLLG